MRALVSGALANKPGNGGAAWTRLSFALGLRRLGFEVLFVEELGSPGPPGAAEWFASVLARFGLRGALIHDGVAEGVPLDELAGFAAEADILVNCSGHLTAEPSRSLPRVKVFVDSDPGYTQIWAASHVAGARLAGHDAYFTVGLSVPRPGSSVPSAGVDWRPLPPPVVLDEWPASPAPADGRFTTVGSWRGAYGPLEWEGRTYGQKAHEFRKLAELPRLATRPFEVALQIDEADARDRELLARNGWLLADPDEVAGTPDAFRDYVRASWAELSAAQSPYVGLRTGWLSDRTARYLASGRPALVQDTGLPPRFAPGEGLLTFRTLEEAAAGAARLEADYEAHAAAARAFAEERLDSDVVLARMLEEAGVG